MNNIPNVELLPKWIFRRYLILWNAFQSREFYFDEAFNQLQKMPVPDAKKIVTLFLSELRRKGWLEVRLDPDDARRRIYNLRPYKDVLEVITQEIAGGGMP